MEFDENWKLKSIELAFNEQLSINGEIDFKTLFTRAKIIYNEGYKHHLQKWKTVWDNKEKKDEEIITIKSNRGKKKETKIEEKKPKLREGYKICPKCGEEVPNGFKIHRYKSNGEDCGYEWN